jgi:predicted small lipoprotein YifL
MMPKPMMPKTKRPIPKRFLLAFCVVTLLDLSIAGCAQKGIVQNVPAPQDVSAPEKWNAPQRWNAPQQSNDLQKLNVQSENCRSCHAPNGAAGARDFSAIYDSPKSHHPVGVKYPLAAQGGTNFQLLDGRNADVSFFDRNGNGQPDSDEIQLFGGSGAATVECASCHKEHGGLPVSGIRSPDFYLRVANVGSALCITCHRL